MYPIASIDFQYPKHNIIVVPYAISKWTIKPVALQKQKETTSIPYIWKTYDVKFRQHY